MGMLLFSVYLSLRVCTLVSAVDTDVSLVDVGFLDGRLTRKTTKCVKSCTSSARPMTHAPSQRPTAPPISEANWLNWKRICWLVNAEFSFTVSRVISE